MPKPYHLTPAARERARARMAALQRRRRCAECSVETPAGPLGRHQRVTGHTGWTAVES